MNLTLEGKLKKVMDTQEISATFKKREFVLETDLHTDYPQSVKFELTNTQVDEIDKYKAGDMLKVHFNVRGREWMSPKNELRYFVSLNAWRLEKVGESQEVSNEAANPPPTPPTDSFSDSLPF